MRSVHLLDRELPQILGERRHDLSAMISAPASPGASSEVPVTVEPDRNVTSQRIWARSSRASAVPMRDPEQQYPDHAAAGHDRDQGDLVMGIILDQHGLDRLSAQGLPNQCALVGHGRRRGAHRGEAGAAPVEYLEQIVLRDPVEVARQAAHGGDVAGVALRRIEHDQREEARVAGDDLGVAHQRARARLHHRLEHRLAA